MVAAGLGVLLLLVRGRRRPGSAERAVPVAHAREHPGEHLALLPVPDAVPAQLISPFTGEPVETLGRVLAVKIDNIVDARPPDNLTSADIVYLLPVEGGLSRIFAVYSSRIPDVIGPVRSAREDDLELLRAVRQAGIRLLRRHAGQACCKFIARARVVNLYDTPAYFRDGSPGGPAQPVRLTAGCCAAEAAGASPARDIGFRFGPAPPGGRPAASVSVSYPAAGFTFVWSARARRWLVWMDGTQATDAAGGDLAAATVVIQDTVVRTSRFLEYGVRPPYARVHRVGHRRGAPRRAGLAGALVPARPGPAAPPTPCPPAPG